MRPFARIRRYLKNRDLPEALGEQRPSPRVGTFRKPLIGAVTTKQLSRDDIAAGPQLQTSHDSECRARQVPVARAAQRPEGRKVLALGLA